MINCPVCRSIWMRPVDREFVVDTDPSWGTAMYSRRFACGGCGAVFVMQLTKIAEDATDRVKNRDHHNPPPKVMLENGGGK